MSASDTPSRCDAVAVDRNTNSSVRCQLRRGHKHTHFWQEQDGLRLWTASWYGPDDGLPIYIGGGDAKFFATETLREDARVD